jgi:hypothetical protein
MTFKIPRLSGISRRRLRESLRIVHWSLHDWMLPISLNPALLPACPAVPVLETSEIGPVSYAETIVSNLMAEVGESNEWNPAWFENLNRKMPMWGCENVLSPCPKGLASQCTCAHFSGGTTIVPLLNLKLMSLGCQRHSSVPLFRATDGLGCNPLPTVATKPPNGSFGNP